MSDSSNIEDAVWNRMDLAAANILGVKDRIDLTEEDGRRLRSVILRELNEFAALCVALVQASADGTQVNDLAIKMLSEIHSAVVGVPQRQPVGG